MRLQGHTWAAICLAILVAGCAAENPTYRGDDDGGAPPSADGGQILPPDQDITQDSVLATLDTAPQPYCTPGAFLGCAGPVRLTRCDETGFGTEILSCPRGCNVKAERCNDCNPNQKPSCQGTTQIACTARGIQVKVACPYGCFAGQCKGCNKKTYYADVDGDGYGDPQAPQDACARPEHFVDNYQDCNDASPDAFPAQDHFFNKPMPGSKSYDYNCDKKEERKLINISLANCSISNGSCTGSGWVLVVPKCGSSGLYLNCIAFPGAGCTPMPGSATQLCR